MPVIPIRQKPNPFGVRSPQPIKPGKKVKRKRKPRKKR